MFEPPRNLERIQYHRQRVTASDGMELAVQSTPDTGPAVLFANGIGVTEPGLDVLVHHLRPRHRCILWDYRGTGDSPVPSTRIRRHLACGSGPPSSGSSDACPGGRPPGPLAPVQRYVDLSMPRHAADALDVLDALGVERAAVLGWSMGVQVGLETIRRAPGRVAGFGALFGAPGEPFRTAFPAAMAALVHALVHAARLAPWPGSAIVRLGAALPPLAWRVCLRTGFVSDRADREIFHQNVCSTARAEGRAYFGVLAELMNHSAADMLGTVRCPVLVVAGERDWVTPPSAAERMAQEIPGARLVVLPDTSHFGVIEHGEALTGPVDDLLAAAFPHTGS